MKRLIETTEGGFESMIGENVVLICGIYIYAGTLVGVSDDHLELDKAEVVYETGPWTAGEWKDAQALPSKWRVMRAAIESWGAAIC